MGVESDLMRKDIFYKRIKLSLRIQQKIINGNFASLVRFEQMFKDRRDFSPEEIISIDQTLSGTFHLADFYRCGTVLLTDFYRNKFTLTQKQQ